MARKIVFPMIVKGHEFKTHKELYNFYYSSEPNYLTEFSKPFWAEGVNLIELVHNPEKFTIIELKEVTQLKTI